MYSRLTYESWTDLIPLAAFVFTILFFSVVAWRGIRLRKEKADRMAALPLDD